MRRNGLALGVGAYLLWGFLPLYLRLLDPAGPLEVIAHRIIWTLVVCGIIVLVRSRGPELIRVIRDRKAVAALALSGALLTGNWLVFVYSISTNQLAEASLGYFINPLITVGLAVIFLDERLRPVQWVALGIAGVAVIIITISHGRLPWIALVLGFSFGLYGYVEKRIGQTVSAAVAMSIETLAIVPLALAYIIYLADVGQQHFTNLGFGQLAAMVGVGLATAVPLLLFNGAARRLPLSVVGLLQYMCPVMQFLTALLIFDEAIATARWIGFGLVWVALLILVTDGLRQYRGQARLMALN